jgi:hypothetical protein
MHIPIHDEDLPAPQPLREARRDDHVVHEAEAHRPLRQRMMPRRTDRGEGVRTAGMRIVDRRVHRADRTEDGVPARVGGDRIEGKGSPARPAHPFELMQVPLGVHQQEILDRTGGNLLDPGTRQPGEARQHHAEPLGGLGMIGPGIVADARRMGEHGNGHAGHSATSGRRPSATRQQPPSRA